MSDSGSASMCISPERTVFHWNAYRSAESVSPTSLPAVSCAYLASASPALVLGLSCSAVTRNIREFSAEGTRDSSHGVDTDSSGTPATVTVSLEENGADVKQAGEQPVKGGLTTPSTACKTEETPTPSVIPKLHSPHRPSPTPRPLRPRRAQWPCPGEVGHQANAAGRCHGSRRDRCQLKIGPAAGIAVALVVVGGALFFGARRRAARSGRWPRTVAASGARPSQQQGGLRRVHA